MFPSIQLGAQNSWQWPRFFSWVLFLLLFFPFFVLSASKKAERLEYTVSYQGGLTAMAKLNICDVLFETSQDGSTISGEPVYRASVQISSKRHKKMEAAYPFRYRILSYFSPDLQRSILFERSKKTRKIRHEIVWFDWEQGVTERYKKRKQKLVTKSQTGITKSASASKKASIPSFFNDLNYDSDEFRRSSKPGQKLVGGMLDRLSLLQSIRNHQLSLGREIRLSISDGKKVLNYLVRVQTRETIVHQGQSWDTYKLRFDAFSEGRWSGRPVHPGVFAWLTADEEKMPVRFSVDYAVGDFVIQLNLDSPVERFEDVASQ